MISGPISPVSAGLRARRGSWQNADMASTTNGAVWPGRDDRTLARPEGGPGQ
jgi:hypothetical protein